jgi:hypothetical protein
MANKEKRSSITKSSFYDAALEDWFDLQVTPHMIKGTLPKDGHDIKEDFKAFAYQLSQDMKLKDMEKISPTETPEMWKKFFESSDVDFKNGLQACPLISEGNGYKFLQNYLIPYFCNAAIYADFLNQKYP